VDAFPLPEAASYHYADEFSAQARGHKGTDIFAARGLPVLAVAGGKARATIDPKGGKVVYLRADNGWSYYYAHLDSWAPPLEAARLAGRVVDVDPGALLGQLGNSGNAKGTSPHLHFQISPPGLGPIDPYPALQAVDPHVEWPNLGTMPNVPPIPKAESDDEPLERSPASWAIIVILLVFMARRKRR